MPEVVEDGTSGYIVDNESDAVAALSRINGLDRHHVRQIFERCFITRRMTDDYLRIYHTLINRARGELMAVSTTLQELDHLRAEHANIADSSWSWHCTHRRRRR